VYKQDPVDRIEESVLDSDNTVIMADLSFHGRRATMLPTHDHSCNCSGGCLATIKEEEVTLSESSLVFTLFAFISGLLLGLLISLASLQI
jgi:hypothetical protein